MGFGKMIISFKIVLFLFICVGFDKVVFLVDRCELDSRISVNFKVYVVFEFVLVDDMKYIYYLKKEFKFFKVGIIVIIIFKLNSLIKELEEIYDFSLVDKKIVFIIDEVYWIIMG